MFGRRFIAILAVSLIAASLIPMAEAQGRGGNRGPIRFEWTAPESAKAANHTVALNKDGAGEATFRIGYSGASGFGDGGGMPGAPRVCQPGTKLVVPILLDPATRLAPHMASITPAKAEFDISPAAPSAPGGSQVKWSEKHVVSVHYQHANITAALATVNITTGPVSYSGGTCTTPASLSMPGKTWVNFTMPAKPKAAALAVEPAEKSPGLNFVSVALVGLVALVYAARRTKG